MQIVNGEIPSQFLSTIGNGLIAETNTAAAFKRLQAAHPGVHTNGPASGYWDRAFDVEIHANPVRFNVSRDEAKRLSPVGHSPHGLGYRLNFSGCTEAVAAQFGFRAFNPYTFDYTGAMSYSELNTGPAGLDLETVARQVIRGVWGNGPDRESRLTAAGYDPAAVQAIVNQELGQTPTPPAPTPNPPVDATPQPTHNPTPNPKPTPAEPAIPTPTTPETPTVKTPNPSVAATAKAIAELESDANRIADTVDGAPLAGLFAGHTKGRKRAYAAYAIASLLVSFGPDLITYGVVTGSHVSVLVSWIGLTTSALLKVGAAFGFVAASNAKG